MRAHEGVWGAHEARAIGASGQLLAWGEAQRAIAISSAGA
jgi:hypothetical protein